MLKVFTVLALALVGLQSCTQPKLVRVPTALVEFVSPYHVDLSWQLVSRKLNYSDSEGLFFALDDRKVYFANLNGMVTAALIESNGSWEEQIQWQRKFNEPISSGPVLSKQGLVVGTSKAQVMLLSPENGNVIWQSELSSEVLSKAVIVSDSNVNGSVFVRTVDGKLYSLSLTTGKVNWTMNHQQPKLSLRGIPPVTYSEGVIYVGWETGKVEAIDASTGELKWQSQVIVPKGRTDLERLIDIQAEMVIKNGRLYVFGYHGKLAVLNIKNGNIFWSKKVSGFQDFIVDNKTLYLVDEDDVLKAYDLLSGTMIWKQSNFKYRQLVDLVSYDEKQILLADGQGYFHWIDKVDGTQLARAKHIEIDKTGEQIIRVSVLNKTIFTLDSQGYVSVYSVKKTQI